MILSICTAFFQEYYKACMAAILTLSQGHPLHLLIYICARKYSAVKRSPALYSYSVVLIGLYVVNLKTKLLCLRCYYGVDKEAM